MKLNKSQKLELEKFKKQNKTRKIAKSNYRWIIITSICTFLISFVFSLISEITVPNVNIYVGLIIVTLFVLIGVIFDIIGIAVTSANIKPFHSMNAKKIKGSDIAIMLIKKAPIVSSFCNDVIGDICGIVSGTTSAAISIIIATKLKVNLFIITLLITSIIATMTIGSKALGKSFAINKSNLILYKCSKFISYFYKIKKQ